MSDQIPADPRPQGNGSDERALGDVEAHHQGQVPPDPRNKVDLRDIEVAVPVSFHSATIWCRSRSLSAFASGTTSAASAVVTSAAHVSATPTSAP